MNESLEDQLRDYFARTDLSAREGAKEQVICALAQEAERGSLQVQAQERHTQEQPLSLVRFALGQVRFIHVRTWILQLLVLGILLALSTVEGAVRGVDLLMVAFALCTVALDVPELFRSYETGIAELEYSCRFNFTQVLSVRMMLLGIADVVWLSIAIALVPALTGCDPLSVFFYACVPFFVACGGCFMIARKYPMNASVACLLFSVAIFVIAWATQQLIPGFYAGLSYAAWSVILAIALGFAIYEITRAFREVAQGLNSASTHHAIYY